MAVGGARSICEPSASNAELGFLARLVESDLAFEVRRHPRAPVQVSQTDYEAPGLRTRRARTL
jgi:hypothetical protein